MLQNGIQWLSENLIGVASRIVEYKRGAHSVLISAIIGRTPFRSTNEYGASVIDWVSRDYLVIASNLILDSVVTTPQIGDVVIDDDGTYEVVSINGEQHFRYSDPYGIMLRIHTKRIAT